MRGRQAALACRRPRDYPRAPMENFAPPARALVAHMIEDAERHPERTVAFQGAPGANSHVAVRQAFPDGLPLPCFDFADAIEAVQDGSADCAMIPIENSLHGRVADIHFLLPERSEEHTSELQSLMRNSYAVFCLKKKTNHNETINN